MFVWVRGSGFYPSALEKGSRSEQAMNLALAEMYVQGVSTRRVITVLQSLLGPEISISSTQISRCTEKLDSGLEAWRNRSLGVTPYVVLDARYEKVRTGGQVVDCAVLIALGIDETGKRRVLGVSVALSEAEVHWRDFLESLMARGLTGVKYIVSDDHAGLRAARRAVLPSVPWQPNFTEKRSFTCNRMPANTSPASMTGSRWRARYARSLPRRMRSRPMRN